MKQMSILLILVFATCQISAAMSERRVNTNRGNTKNVDGLPIPKQWEKLVDSSSEEFWLGHNPQVDKGYLIFATNRTKENARLWLLRMAEMRNAWHEMNSLVEQVNIELIQEGLIPDDYNFLEMHQNATGQTRPTAAKKERTDYSAIGNVEIYYLYNPHCPVCKRQAMALKSLQNVYPVQLGGELLENIPGFRESVWPDENMKELVKRHNPNQNVPMLLLYKRDSNEIAPLIGYSSIERIAHAAKRLTKND